MGISIGDIEAGRDVTITQMAQQADVAKALRELQVAREEDKPALVKRLLERWPDLVVPIVTAAVPHLLK